MRTIRSEAAFRRSKFAEISGAKIPSIFGAYGYPIDILTV